MNYDYKYHTDLSLFGYMEKEVKLVPDKNSEKASDKSKEQS